MADTRKEGDSPEEAEQERRADDDRSRESHLYEDWDDLATDPEEMSRVGRAIEGLLPDILKRGVGGLVSEDGIRSLVKDRELPREAAGFILGQVDATKREVLRIVSKEVRLFLQNVDLGGELTKILTSVSFEVRTEVRFIPNDSAVKPNVRNRVSIRGQNGEKEAPAEAERRESGGVGEERSSAEASEEDGASEPGEQAVDAPDEPEEPRRRRWSLRRRGGGSDEAAEPDEGSEDKPSQS